MFRPPRLATICGLLGCLALTPLGAEEATPSEEVSLLALIQAGSWIGYIIIGTSVIAMALAIDQFLALRRERRQVEEVATRFQGGAASERETEVAAWCRDHPSLIGNLLVAGLLAREDHREQAVQDEAAEYAGRLYRKAEYLLFIGNIAPMLGLLGTVVGMMQSFNVIAARGGGADPGELADGISKALVTTCMGLLVALPALVLYTTARNRIDTLLGSVGRQAERLLFPERRNTALEAVLLREPAAAQPATEPRA